MKASTFRPVTAAGVSSFKPVTGWRWWLHLGHNETRLMHPRKPIPAVLGELTAALSRGVSALGVSMTAAGQAMTAWGEAWRRSEGKP